MSMYVITWSHNLNSLLCVCSIVFLSDVSCEWAEDVIKLIEMCGCEKRADRLLSVMHFCSLPSLTFCVFNHHFLLLLTWGRFPSLNRCIMATISGLLFFVRWVEILY